MTLDQALSEGGGDAGEERAERQRENEEKGGEERRERERHVCATVKRNRIHGNFLPDARTSPACRHFTC